MEDKYIRASLVTESMVKDKLPYRKQDSHKGTFGKLLCVCGSRCMPGAAYFTVASALKCGVGSVKVCAVSSVYEIVSQKISEPTFCIVPEDENGFICEKSIDIILKETEDCSAVVVGPGVGDTPDTERLVCEIIKKCRVPLLVDADGINAISKNINILKEAFCNIILTPHPKEMSRLTGISTEDINANKFKCAKEFAEKHKVTVLLKGHKTVICGKEEESYINIGGNSGLAKGGSGDVLSGMIGSFLAQGLSCEDSAVCGAFLHTFAGNRCAEKFSERAMTPQDVVNELSEVFTFLE